MSLRKAMWRGGLFGSQFYPNGNGLWRGGLWASQLAGGGGGGEPDYSAAQIGDEIGGGIYAGKITYADAREFHIIFAPQSGEADPALEDTRWQIDTTSVFVSDLDDGAQNTQDLLASGKTHPAANYCAAYNGGGQADWYLGALNEMALEANLRGHPELSTDTSNDRWTSCETSSSSARTRSFTGSSLIRTKTIASRRVRPIRRVPV